MESFDLFSGMLERPISFLLRLEVRDRVDLILQTEEEHAIGECHGSWNVGFFPAVNFGLVSECFVVVLGFRP